MNVDPERVMAVEPGPRAEVIDIETSTRTFYAAGLATHNCFARPTHETLGFSSGLDFETKILVKRDAPALLRDELSRMSWKPQVIAISGVTDAYQPIERRLGLTRACLEVLAEFRNPVLIVTKNHLVARDRDLLGDLARDRAAGVCVSVTSLDGSLQRRLEPRTSPPERRLEAIRMLSEAGVPVGALVAPVIPGLTDHEMPAILRAAADAGARFAGYVPLRLPYAVKEIFERWLDDHFPDRKQKVLGRIRDLRGGRLNDPRFGSRLRGEGIFAEEIGALFAIACRRAGIAHGRVELSAAAFRRPRGPQLALF
jgi:DNA repair photolyase